MRRTCPVLHEWLILIYARLRYSIDENAYSVAPLQASVSELMFAALLFGYVHFHYQGLTGFVNAGVIGLIFGTFFSRYKRNLWPLILAHGFIDTLGFTSEFMGWGI